MNCTSSVRASTVLLTDLPLTVREMGMSTPVSNGCSVAAAQPSPRWAPVGPLRTIVRAAARLARKGFPESAATFGRRWRRAERRARGSGRAAAKAVEAVVALGRGEAAKAGAAQAGAGRERRPAQHLVAAERRQRVVAPRPRDEARMRPEGRRRPLAHIAPAKAARRALVCRGFPLDLARQPPSGPAAPRIGFMPADVHGRVRRRHAREDAEATLQDAVAHLVDVAWRAPPFALEPGPAGFAP